MGDELITVRCACGWEMTGTEPDVVSATVEHGQRLHNMTPTHDEVLAMAVPTDHRAPPTDSSSTTGAVSRGRSR